MNRSAVRVVVREHAALAAMRRSMQRLIVHRWGAVRERAGRSAARRPLGPG
jgi:hypothetical protein